MMKILTFSSLPSARIVVVLEACSCKLQHAISSTTRSSSAAACIMQLSSLYHAVQQPVSCSAAACIMQRSSLYHAAPQPSTVLQKAVEAQG